MCMGVFIYLKRGRGALQVDARYVSSGGLFGIVEL